jgi:hypothetical protein
LYGIVYLPGSGVVTDAYEQALPRDVLWIFGLVNDIGQKLN